VKLIVLEAGERVMAIARLAEREEEPGSQELEGGSEEASEENQGEERS